MVNRMNRDAEVSTSENDLFPSVKIGGERNLFSVNVMVRPYSLIGKKSVPVKYVLFSTEINFLRQLRINFFF